MTSFKNLLMLGTILTTLPVYGTVGLDGDEAHSTHQQRARTERPDDVVGVEEYPGRYEYDGRSVFGVQTQMQTLRNGERRMAHTRRGHLRGHEGRQVIHTDLFDIGSGLPPRLNGHYDFKGDLLPQEHMAKREPGQLLYSDGKGGYFLPHVTQERWQREGQFVGAFVASYDANRDGVAFLDGIRMGQGEDVLHSPLPAGLYQLTEVNDLHGERQESWTRLVNGHPQAKESAARAYTFYSAEGIASIPGVGSMIKRTLPAREAEELVKTLAQRVLLTDASLEGLYTHTQANGNIIALGATGTGKTTLLHLLAGRQLTARKTARGLRLDALDGNLIRGFHIGQNRKTGTHYPTTWYDEREERYVTDCPGFGDVAGGQADAADVYGILKLLRSGHNAKILFALRECDLMERTNILSDSLDQLTGLFQNGADLERGISLVVTQTTDVDVPSLLHELSEEISEDAAEFKISDASKRLLRFFAENPSRVTILPKPTVEGPYDVPEALDQLDEVLGRSEFVHYNPEDLGLQLSAEAQVMTQRLCAHLNASIQDYIAYDGVQRLLHHVRTLATDATTDLATLRGRIGAVAQHFEILGRGEELSVDGFMTAVSRYIDVNPIRARLEQLDLLSRLGGHVEFRTNDWVQAFGHVADQINRFAKAPEVTVEGDGPCTLKGCLVGVSDVAEALEAHQKDRVQVFAWNRFFVDQDLHAPSTSLAVVAPNWTVVGSHSIDLSGDEGAPGADGAEGETGMPGGDGQPGQPGGSGGHFFGKVATISHAENLRIISNAGNGGRGGNGGVGGAGADGKDGNLGKWTSKTDHDTQYWRRGKLRRGALYSTFYYEDKGTPGTQGADGGRAALGGKPGLPGCVALDNYLNIAQVNGAEIGADGNPGPGGIGGLIGKNCRGITEAGYNKENSGSPNLPFHRVVSKVEHVPQQTERALHGSKPSELSDALPADPKVIAPIDATQVLDAYEEGYLSKARTPDSAPFVESFPGLNH